MANHVKGAWLQSTVIGAEYTTEEVEFLKAVDAYRLKTRTRFLTATDYMKILIKLGYSRPKSSES